MTDESETKIVAATETDREAIRAQISQMSFEDLQKLKEKIGCKVYNEDILGIKGKKKQINDEFKRKNKNRPREMSSKRPQQNSLSFGNKTLKSLMNKNRPRDPRFDPLCGNFNEKAFERSYSFINVIKQKEREILGKELKSNADPDQQNKIKYLIQRMDNQRREKIKKEKEEDKNNTEKKIIREKLRKGDHSPIYQRKSEKKMMNLLSQYEELKQNKKLKKHMEKKSKKLSKKDFKNK